MGLSIKCGHSDQTAAWLQSSAGCYYSKNRQDALDFVARAEAGQRTLARKAGKKASASQVERGACCFVITNPVPSALRILAVGDACRSSFQTVCTAMKACATCSRASTARNHIADTGTSAAGEPLALSLTAMQKQCGAENDCLLEAFIPLRIPSLLPALRMAGLLHASCQHGQPAKRARAVQPLSGLGTEPSSIQCATPGPISPSSARREQRSILACGEACMRAKRSGRGAMRK